MLNLLLRKGLLRLIVGVHILGLSAALSFLFFGERMHGQENIGEPFALLVMIGASIQLALGLSLVTRVFYQKGRTNLSDINKLKN